VFRAFFLCFTGDYRGKADAHDAHGHGGGHDDHGHGEPHESPAVMWIPLAILAVLSVAGGWLFNIPKFLRPLFPLRAGQAEAWLTWVSVAFGLGGIGLACVFYVLAPGIPDALAGGLRWLYTLIYNKYFVDELYDATVIRPVIDGSRGLLWRGVDVGVIDGTVN